MSTLTKEWLLTTIAELEEERDAVPGVVNEDAANALAAMKLALASLEAEPVCVIDQSNLDYLNSGSDADVWPASRAEMGDVLLYRAAPPAPVSVPDDYFSSLVAAARVRADKAMRKFPQPNYVLNKVAEESGEVIKAVIHFTEGREEWQNVEGEIIDNLAMLIRLVMEGDQVIGFAPPDACRAAMLQGADGALTNEDTKRVDELVIWIKRLAHSLRKAKPDSKLQSDAMDYLSRNGLIGVEDILR
ncbi:hypothetical protein ACNKQC_001843 [Enterobacter hormaechei]